MRKLYILAAILFAAFSLSACQSKAAPSKPTNSADLTIKFDGNSTKHYDNIKLSDNESVMKLLESQTSVKQTGGFITSISGHEQNAAKKQYWMFKVNGKLAMKGANDIKLKNNDNVEFYLGD